MTVSKRIGVSIGRGMSTQVGVVAVALPTPLLLMPLKDNLDLLKGVGVATFTRSTIGTFVDKDDGLVKTAAIDVARFESEGYLSEGGSVSLLFPSELFDDAAWSKTNSTITANNTTAPDGNLTADKLVEDTSAGVHDVRMVFSFVSGNIYTSSFFIEPAERTRVRIRAGNVATWAANSIFDLSNGTIVSSDNGTATITLAANGFFRCTITGNALVTTSTNIIAQLVDSGTNTSYTGDGTSGVELFGGMHQILPFASSYIKTVLTTGTANPDNLSIDATNIPAPTADYTVSMEVDVLGLDLTKTQTVYSVDGETDRKIEINTTTGLVEATHGAVTSTSTTALVAGVKIKIAFAVGGTNQTLYINGIQEAQDTKGTVTGTATGISIGNAAGSSQLFGTERNFRIYDVALTSQQVAVL